MGFVGPIYRSQAAPALDQILASQVFDGATVCAYVTDSDGTVLYSKNGTTRVSPASNEKLFSAAFALYELGPDYRPATKVWVEKDRVDVESDGDPTLSHDDLKNLGKALGLDGRLPVAVKQAYDPEIPEGWEYGDLPNRYAAPVAAFSVDQSGFELWNDNGKLELRPESYGVAIHTIRSSGHPKFTYDPVRRLVGASGKFPKKVERLDTLATPNACQAAASLLGKGMTSLEEDPPGDPTRVFSGRPLSEVLGRCLQKSDNNMAENLLLMGANRLGPLDVHNPYPQALTSLKDFATRVAGVLADDVFPRDGCGLTRGNLVTVRAIASVLNWERTQPTFPLWTSSLASPGVGTLASRLHGINFHGKTGSLSHVTALSGYLVTPDGKNLTVSVVVNNYNCSDSQAHATIDNFFGYIFRHAL
jgi:D-alanyl-D-alanine carboxypeptidase/D-alanyl-D-alanine-endopeptidase (penicillin-binding protein 4)